MRKAGARAGIVAVDDDTDAGEAGGARRAARVGAGVMGSGPAPASPDPLAAFPVRLRHSTEYAQRVYERAPDLYALPAPAATAGATAAARPERSLSTDSGGRLDIFRAVPGAAPAGAQAIYVEPASGQWMVPSGRVFVRFVATASAESRRGALLRAGYRIVALPSYAAQAAWLEAADGEAAHALAGIDRLEALADVENVEPQWLGERQAK